MNEFFNACHDVIDERDYEYQEVFWTISEDNIPDEYYIDDGDLQDQTKWYPYGCVFFAQSQADNIMNFYEGSDLRNKWWELCDYAKSKNLFDPEYGALIINGPKVWLMLWFLSWYTKVSSLNEIKHSIANKRPVQVGSNKIAWDSWNSENWFTISWWDSYGHSVIITWYSDKTKKLRIKHAYKKWDSGFQYLNYSDLELLYPSRYSLIDKEDEKILAYKKSIMDNIKIEKAKTAFTNWFWNWTDPQENASREEVATMIQRAYEKLISELKK